MDRSMSHSTRWERLAAEPWVLPAASALPFADRSGISLPSQRLLTASLRFACVFLVISGACCLSAPAQQAPTPEDTQVEDALYLCLRAQILRVPQGEITRPRTVSSLVRSPTDPDRVSDSETGKNYVYDHEKHAWTDAETGEPVTPTANNLEDAFYCCLRAQILRVPQGDLARPRTVSSLVRSPTDPDSVSDSETGKNYVYDHDRKAWIDAATGECICPACTAPQPEENKPIQPPTPTQPAPEKSVSMSGFTPAFQFRGFGGASIINGNTPGTAGFDGAVLFPLGNRVLVGPTAGFQWVDSSIVSHFGSMTPGSTFANESVGFKEGNFGGRIGFPFGGFQISVQGGATVASSIITQNTGFCGNGTPTGGPAGCMTTSSTTAHDTVVGPFVGGYISHSIFSHVGVFVEYDYHRLKDTKSSVSVFDLHHGDIVAGLVLSFGRHNVK
ncbi:MAG: outer membrane protein [Candidatus Acidiferrales bacterium]